MNIQLSSGLGPAECELAVGKFLAWLEARYAIDVLLAVPGRHEGAYKSVLLATDADLSPYLGTVQWACQSPYRPHHGRKNWFIDVSRADVATDVAFDQDLVVFQTFRASGKGGQHVNKTETAVRAIYRPTGDFTVCQDERSQHTNKQRAVEQLRCIVERRNSKRKSDAENANWQQHTRLQRGDAVAVFVGEKFEKRE